MMKEAYAQSIECEEPCEGRLSRTVLWEGEGETPSLYSTLSCHYSTLSCQTYAIRAFNSIVYEFSFYLAKVLNFIESEAYIWHFARN